MFQDLPEAIGYAALLGLDGTGAPVAGSGLSRREGGRFELRISETAPPESYRLFGWSEAELRSVALSPQLSADFSPLSVAGPADPVLPPPTLRAAGARADARFEPDPAPAPDLTIAWLPRCPVVFDPNQPLLGDLQCARRRCDLTMTQKGCGFEIDTGLCRLGTFRGSIDGRGRLTLAEHDPQLTHCRSPVEPNPLALHAMACQLEGFDCRFELHASGRESELELTRVALGRPGLEGRGRAEIMPPKGALGGLAVLADHLVVARYAAWVPTGACTIADAGELLFLDKATLSVVGTATAPPCLERLASGEGGAEFFGTFRRAGEVYLGRFDPGGRRLAEARLPPVAPLPSANTTENHPRALLARGGRVFVAFALSDDVLAYDADSLALAWRAEGNERQLRTDLVPTPAGLVVSDLADVLYFFDPASGEVRPDVSVTTSCRASVFEPSNMMFHTGAERLLLLNADPGAEVYALTRDRVGCESATYFEGEGEAYAAVPWGPEGEGALVGLWDEAGGEASLAVLELEPPRFRPGARRWSSAGPPWDLQVEAEVVFGLLPWSAEVFRVTPGP